MRNSYSFTDQHLVLVRRYSYDMSSTNNYFVQLLVQGLEKAFHIGVVEETQIKVAMGNLQIIDSLNTLGSKARDIQQDREASKMQGPLHMIIL